MQENMLSKYLKSVADSDLELKGEGGEFCVLFFLPCWLFFCYFFFLFFVFTQNKGGGGVKAPPIGLSMETLTRKKKTISQSDNFW